MAANMDRSLDEILAEKVRRRHPIPWSTTSNLDHPNP
jgi:hypothetical protein